MCCGPSRICRIVALMPLLQVMLSITFLTTSFAMEFRIERDPDEGINVIIGEGPIIDGDAARLVAIVPRAERDKFGNIHLYLNSPGGLVAASFEIVTVMDRYAFRALVSANAIC